MWPALQQCILDLLTLSMSLFPDSICRSLYKYALLLCLYRSCYTSGNFLTLSTRKYMSVWQRVPLSHKLSHNYVYIPTMCVYIRPVRMRKDLSKCWKFFRGNWIAIHLLCSRNLLVCAWFGWIYYTVRHNAKHASHEDTTHCTSWKHIVHTMSYW